MPRPPVAPERLHVLKDVPERTGERGRYVLYWCTAARRMVHNHALDLAAARAKALGVPLVVLEGLRADHPYAAPRFHAFVLAGMRDNAAACEARDVTYWPFLEPEPGAGKGLLEAWARDAALVVADHHPGFFFPRMRAAAKRVVAARLMAVDNNGLLPLACTEGPFATAFAFRRHLQATLPAFLGRGRWPKADALKTQGVGGKVEPPRDVARHWPPTDLAHASGLLRMPSLDAEVGVVEALPGGPAAGAERLRGFVRRRARYGERNHPDADAASGLSPYLHFGHVGAHQVVAAVLRAEGWSVDDLGEGAAGKRTGWWGTSAPVEAFLDQVVTWRELGHVELHHRPGAASYATLPEWARATLHAHRNDPREVVALEDLEAARSPDAVWNAAQRQLRRGGVVHNYLRMLWGKLLLPWSATPQEALERTFQLNDRWALDGRDPNSVCGITWCLGRYDRAWGPERPVFGKLRYMSSTNTQRKLRLDRYLARWGDGARDEPLT